MIPLQPGAVGSLALALFHKWEPERLFVLVTVYIDESGTHGSGYTILGGWVGRLGQWSGFDPEWRRLLKQNGLPYFHSRKLRHSKPPFEGWRDDRKSAFMAKAARLATKNLAFGFTVSLSDSDYDEHYVAGYRPKRAPLDSRYGLCFRFMVGVVSNLIREAFPNRPLDVHFVLESGHRNYGDAERVFHLIKSSKEPKEDWLVAMLRTLTSGDKKDFPGLQVADVLAYNAFAHFTRSPTTFSSLPREKPLSHAKKSSRGVPLLHLTRP